jgi:hypothetical protein
MKQALRFSQLSPPRKALVRFCQSLNFGSILDLRVIASEVVFDALPDVLIDVRLDEELSGRPEAELTDFALSTELRRLFSAIDTIGNGTIEKIVVHAGVPRRVTIRRPLSEIVS